jgi:hypothetical protein
MSRPADESNFAQAEGWMASTFGLRMVDYLRARKTTPLSVAVVEVDRVLKAAGVERLLRGWREEDVKSAAGRPSHISAMGALSLMLLQLRLGGPTLITEIAETFLDLSPRQRAVLRLTHDGEDERAYDRIGAAIQRLIALVDEFPGARRRVLSEEAFVAMLDARDEEGCRARRERMFNLTNALLEGTRKLLPAELIDRMDGNVAIDATFAAMSGKLGNPASWNRTGDRRTVNPDAGWYRRSGDHGAMTSSDAASHNKSASGEKKKGTAKSKLSWGIEIEIARATANYLEQAELFPLITVAMSFHIPGALVGEGTRMVKSLKERDHKMSFVIVDRAYSNGKYPEYAVPIRLLGAKHVFDYKDDQLGVQAFDPRGFVQVSGSWFLDTLPDVLRNADKKILAARNAHRKAPEKTKAVELALSQAESLYTQQLDRRARSRLLYKGHMTDDLTRRYLIPIDSPDYARWKAQPNAAQGLTVMMKAPKDGDKDADRPNASGLKHEQYFHYGTPEWKAAYGMRNGVESVNANLKRPQYEDIGDPEKRAVRGNTFTYIVVALAAIVENLRQMLSFYKRKLGIKKVTAKNKKRPTIFWQSKGPAIPAPPDPRAAA